MPDTNDETNPDSTYRQHAPGIAIAGPGTEIVGARALTSESLAATANVEAER